MIFSERMVTQNTISQNNVNKSKATQNSSFEIVNQKYAYLTAYLRHAHPSLAALLSCRYLPQRA